MAYLVRLKGVSHSFRSDTYAVQDINLDIQRAAFTVLIGPSGAGKSTLMRIVNGLVRPSQGEVWTNGTEMTTASPETVRRVRRQVGMVFQQFNLVRRLTALDNVLIGRLGYLPSWRTLLRQIPKVDLELAMSCLERVGMADYAWQRADTLSGGQQQRVGIARALAQQPSLILADEPISALDPKSAEQVMEILRGIHEKDGITVIANLHFLGTVREYADRVIGLRAGRVVFDGTAQQLTDSVARELYYGEMETLSHTGLASNQPEAVVSDF